MHGVGNQTGIRVTELFAKNKVLKTVQKIEGTLNKKTDWSGQKYLVAQELGECIDMTFGHYSQDSQEWFLRSHSLSDGVSAFDDLLALKSFHRNKVPQTFNVHKPHWIKRVLLFLKYLKSTQPISYDWKFNDTSQKGAGPGLAYSYFTREETLSLKSYAKEKQVSLNSLILYALDKVVVKNLLLTSQERAWLIPVNMRGGVDQANDSANYTASLTMKLDQTPTIEVIDSQIKRLYSSGIAWGSWIYSNITKYLGFRLLKFFAKNYKSSWIGVFSNMGAWSGDIMTQHLTEDFWIAAPPVTSLCPVTAAALSWNDKLGLTLQLHPSIARLEGDVQKVMTDWVFALRELLSEQSQFHPQTFCTSWKEMNTRAQRF